MLDSPLPLIGPISCPSGTIVFLDTKFTELTPAAALISLGAVTTSGENFYAELADGWDRDQTSPFVKESVLPLLGAAEVSQLTLDELAEAFARWIARQPPPVVLASDSHWDWTLFWKLYSGERAISTQVIEPRIIRLTGKALLNFNDELNAYFLRHPAERKHHALSDAKALCGAYLKGVSELAILGNKNMPLPKVLLNDD